MLTVLKKSWLRGAVAINGNPSGANGGRGGGGVVWGPILAGVASHGARDSRLVWAPPSPSAPKVLILLKQVDWLKMNLNLLY